MLIWTTRFSRKKAVFAVLLLGIVLAAIILLAGGRSFWRYLWLIVREGGRDD